MKNETPNTKQIKLDLAGGSQPCPPSPSHPGHQSLKASATPNPELWAKLENLWLMQVFLVRNTNLPNPTILSEDHFQGPKSTVIRNTLSLKQWERQTEERETWSCLDQIIGYSSWKDGDTCNGLLYPL